MTSAASSRKLSFSYALLAAVAGVSLGTACLDSEGTGIASGGQTSTAGKGSTPGEAGKPASSGGSANAAGQGSDDPVGGTTSTTAGQAAMMPEGGTPNDDPGVLAGAGGEPSEGVHIAHACTFHTDVAPPDTGAGGTGPAPDVVAQLNPFVGSYLTDAAGRTLYTYGADLPGDCQTPPQSLCVADCLVSWPVFDAGARVLGAGLNDAGFGTIQRPDGGSQTTYQGWPLYYYKSDLALGQVTGQGKGKTWHVAEVAAPSVVIMKAGTLKYLADAWGHTLYVSAADQAGSAEDEPVSNCKGSCLQTFEGFHEKNLSVVTSLETLDFEVFARHGAGGLQLAYKGMPLYRAATDLKSGDMNGTAVTGFTAAVP
jgi:predicted lipoprotein with Yx(FWY)xxD motif